MQKYAVVGNPIGHSKSPLIHQQFAEQVGHELSYEKIELSLETFSQDITQMLHGGGYSGLNVTVPFKERAWRICASLSSRAELAGAVNTIYVNDDGEIAGENTDGIGLCTDLVDNNQVPIKGKKILMLGAGGAVRGVIPALLEYRPEQIVISNRTHSKALALEELFRGEGPVLAQEFKDLGQAFDIIINGTSASLQGDLPPIPSSVIGGNTDVYDMMYAADKTVFNQWAEEQGARQTIDGLGMLVEQAAEAFLIWRGIRPDTKEVIAKLRRDNS